MRRLCACFLSLMLLFSSACAEPVTDDALLILAEVMAESVDIFAGSDALHELYQTPDNIRSIIASWAAGEHSEPVSVYRIVLDEEMLSMLVTVDSLPTVVTSSILQRAMVAVISSLNAAYGTEALAAASAASVSTGFSGAAECCIYILTYAEGADIAVCFYPFDGGTAGAYAAFLAGNFEQNHLADWQTEALIERLR